MHAEACGIQVKRENKWLNSNPKRKSKHAVNKKSSDYDFFIFYLGFFVSGFICLYLSISLMPHHSIGNLRISVIPLPFDSKQSS